jgi:hypothetical protein
VDHLLLHCDVAHALWSTIFNRVGRSWVMHKQVVDLFACYREIGSTRVQLCGIMCLFAFCVFGRKEMIEVLRITKRR